MDSKSHSLLIFISLSSLLLIFSSSSSFVEATCKPRYLTHPIPSSSSSSFSSSSSSSSSQSNHISTSSSPSSTSPPPKKQASTPSSSSPPPSPPKRSSSPPPPPTSSPPPPPTPTPTPKSSPPPPTPTPSPPPSTTTQAAESISLFSQTPTPTTSSSPSPKTILPSIPSVISSIAGGINAAIKDICAKTDNVDICLSSIAPFIVPGKTDPISVFGMQLQAVNAHTQTAINTATQMFQNPLTPKIVKSCAEDCKDIYVDAMDNLKAAADALTRRDFPTVDTMLSAAISDFETCEDGFSDFEEESPMSAADDLLEKMTSNLLALSSVCKSLP